MKRRLALSVLAFSVAITGPVFSAHAFAAPQDQQAAPDRDHDRDQAQGGWDTPPREFREIQRQGFHDGVEGARKDFDHHRAPNVERREEFRHPHVSESARDDYREGFRRGYDAAMHHLMEGEGH